MALCSSRRLRGGGKYSSSSVMRSSSTPRDGDRRAMTAATNSSGAEAPAVTPTTPERSDGSSSATLMRWTRGQPASTARRSRARVFEEFADPITTIASQRGAIDMSADCRFVVAKQRSERPGVQTSGNRSRTRTATPSQSRWLSVVWASSATGSANSGRASTSSIDSTRLIASGATAIVPTASSWPSCPT